MVKNTYHICLALFITALIAAGCDKSGIVKDTSPRRIVK